MPACAGMEELIRLGAYRKGSDPGVDRAAVIDRVLEAVSSQRGEGGRRADRAMTTELNDLV